VVKDAQKNSLTSSEISTPTDPKQYDEEKMSDVQPSKSPYCYKTDFEVLKLIGEGGYGKVLLVRKRSDPSQLFAMKVLNKSALNEEKSIRSLKTEKQILADTKHPNIVHLKYAFQTMKRLFLVMEFCCGISKNSDMYLGGELFFNLQNGRFGEKKARFYAANVALALEHLHKNKIIYREYFDS